MFFDVEKNHVDKHKGQKSFDAFVQNRKITASDLCVKIARKNKTQLIRNTCIDKILCLRRNNTNFKYEDTF